MGMGAALKLRPVVANVAMILAIELLAASQALDLLTPLQTGLLAEKARALVRRASAQVTRDRPLSRDIARVSELVRAGEFAAAVR
jgi:histidine ammonia-lyase